jgi:hypothetical protein
MHRGVYADAYAIIYNIRSRIRKMCVSLLDIRIIFLLITFTRLLNAVIIRCPHIM